MISPLGYMIYYQDKENIKKIPIEMKKLKKKIILNDFDTKINKEYMNKDYINNILSIKYFA